MIIDLILDYTEGDERATQYLTHPMGSSVLSCMVSAPRDIAKWQEVHVGAKIVAWRCEQRENQRSPD